MAITYFFSFTEAKERLESLAPSAIDTANRAYNEVTYKNALNLMRQCLEDICQAIIYKKSLNPTVDIAAIKNSVSQDKAKELNSLIDLIGKNDNKWLADAIKTGQDEIESNRNGKSKFHSVREKGNLGSHESKIIPTYQDVEECKVNLRLIIQWFYEDIANSPIPADIQDAIKGQSLTADQRKKKDILSIYYKGLKAQYNSPILIDKNYKLSDLYIVPTETEKAVNNWLNQSEQCLFLLLGDAGQGKSSFCKYLLHQLLKSEAEDINNPDDLKTSITNDPTSRPICFFRLRDITDVESLTNKPVDFLWEQVCNDINPDKPFLEKSEFYKSILILDGLDELHLLSEKNFAADFIKKLLTNLKNLSNLRVLITSRKGVLDEKFEDKLLATNTLAKINLQQQQDWLKKYKRLNINCALTAEQLEFFNTDSNFNHIKELLELPILLHFIALANIKVDENSNRGDIYKSLFQELENRDWEGGKLKPLKSKSINLQATVREVAFVMHNKQSEFITAIELKELLPNNLLPGADVFQYLMLAFYTQQKSDNQALEFLHKSLMEYMVAEYIWEKLKCFSEKQPCKSEFKINNSDTAIKLVWTLFSPRLLSEEIQNYLSEIIQTETDNVVKATVFERMMYFAPELLEKHFLHEIKGKMPINHALFTFRAYWVVLAALSNGENTVPENGEILFVELLKMQQSFVEQYWNLEKANLSYANLNNVNLIQANLKSADLRSADLSNANLSNANLKSADLRSANLSNADLYDANLYNADLSNVYLSNANLSNANLEKSALRDADLSNTDLSNANLYDANLSYANLSYANLSGADLSYANLSYANFNIEQLYRVHSLYGTIGLSDEQITHLKEKGLGHLFEFEYKEEYDF
jgi:Pentapeptide repeats (8 copies)